MLISRSYRQLQSQLHAEEETYGSASVSFAGQVATLIERLGSRTVLDCGAGKQRLRVELAKALNPMPEYRPYGPEIEAISVAPDPADLVVCIDVLEHIEPTCLEAVIDDLARVTRGHGFFAIATGPARRALADGRNAHLTQQPMEWWLPRLWTRFHTTAFNAFDGGFWVLVQSRP